MGNSRNLVRWPVLTFAAEPGDVDGGLRVAPAALAVVRVLRAKSEHYACHADITLI